MVGEEESFVVLGEDSLFWVFLVGDFHLLLDLKGCRLGFCFVEWFANRLGLSNFVGWWYWIRLACIGCPLLRCCFPGLVCRFILSGECILLALLGMGVFGSWVGYLRLSCSGRLSVWL